MNSQTCHVYALVKIRSSSSCRNLNSSVTLNSETGCKLQAASQNRTHQAVGTFFAGRCNYKGDSVFGM